MKYANISLGKIFLSSHRDTEGDGEDSFPSIDPTPSPICTITKSRESPAVGRNSSIAPPHTTLASLAARGFSPKSDFDPTIQLLRACVLVGSLQNFVFLPSDWWILPSSKIQFLAPAGGGGRGILQVSDLLVAGVLISENPFQMVDSRFLITVSKPSDRRRRSSSPASADTTVAPLSPAGNLLTHPTQRNRKKAGSSNLLNNSPCHWSHGAAADVVILVAVIFACGFLLLPYLQLFYHGLAGFGGSVLSELRDESIGVPTVWLFVVLGFFLFSVTVSVALLRSTSGRKCSNPNCRGLRNAAEFDVMIETEERMKNSSCPDGKDGSGRLFFELNEGHHKELEAELKKMAPPRGRAILLFQERCGCSVGRLVVKGPKKVRKVKK